MERVVEMYFLITGVVIGLSHMLQPEAWIELFAGMHRMGRRGAFVNGGVSLVPGALILAGHPVWSGAAAVLTWMGVLFTLKGLVCFLAPDKGVQSLALAEKKGARGFVLAGWILLALAALQAYVLWSSAR